MTRYGYWPQVGLANGRYRVYAVNVQQAIGKVVRVGSKWRAQLYTDPLITGKGRTRDDAVDDAYRQVGGPG